MTPNAFERHLAWLKEECDVISFRTMLNEVCQPKRDRPAVAITFDDGYADNWEYAFPLLKKYNMPATLFLTAGLICGNSAVRQRFQTLRGVAAPEIAPLAWSHIREMSQEGVEIGAHTNTHPNLLYMDARAVRHELLSSKLCIEEQISMPVDVFAYPFGKPRCHFDTATIATVRECGFKYAAAVLSRGVKRSDSALALPRFSVARDSLATLSAKIRGSYDYLGLWQEHAPLSVVRVLSPEDFRK